MAKSSGTAATTLCLNDEGGAVSINGRQYGLNKILVEAAAYMTGSQSLSFSQAVSAQPHGIVLVWSFYSDSTARNWSWNHHFIPKHHVLDHEGQGIQLGLVDADGYHMGKYVYLYDTKITGYSTNSSSATTKGGVSICNANWVLRYVIGV